MKFKMQKEIKIVIAALCLMLTYPMAAFASEDSIKSVSVRVESSVEADAGQGTVSATSESEKYHMVSCEFVSNKDSWKVGEVPRVLITLEAEEGYYFSSINAGKTKIRGADYVTCRRDDNNHTLLLTVKLDPVKGILEMVEDAYWESSPLGKARWSKVENAPAYELKLYRGDSLVHHVEKTTTTSYDFFGHMTSKGDYYFKVRAVPKTTSQKEYLDESDWTESDVQEITARDAIAVSDRKETTEGSKSTSGPNAKQPGWNQDVNGWWYQNEDGSYPTNAWMYINDKWYLFGMDGYMLTGWQKKNGREYYLNSNGEMVTGWLQYNRQWFYLDPNQGKMSGGWLAVGELWYYLNPDGSMYTGWIRSDGKWYYLDPSDGHMVKDQVVGQYYINPDGVWAP